MMQVGTERPRFRQDLLAESVDEQGAKFIDVMDPDSGSVFRFYEVEFSIACAMDGERDVPGIVQWAQDELGVTPTAHEVRAVIATLGDLGYLDLTAAAKAAAADVPPAPTARTGVTSDTVVDAKAVPPAEPPRTPIPVEDRSQRPAAAAPPPAPGTTSEVSLDLSEHMAVGPADVQAAVRESKVMAAVEVPPDLLEPEAPPPRPAAPVVPPVAPVTERPVARAHTPTPMERPSDRIKAPGSVEAERPVERPAERPRTPVPAERPAEAQKPAIVLPQAPEKQPVTQPEPTRRVSVVFIVLVLLVVGVGAFLVWKLVLDKSNQPAKAPAVGAPVAPQPAPSPPPGPPPSRVVTSKIEMTSGRPKTILAFFAGTIEWIETASGKEVKSGDVIMKLAGAKPLEAQVAALSKEVAKLRADVDAAYKARDAVASDEAALKKAQAKVDAVEKVYDAKNMQLVKKVDQLEPYLVRLILDGTLTVTRKVGDRIAENTPIATIVPAPAPSAIFKVPPDVRYDIESAMAVRLGESIITCEVAEQQPGEIRMTCDPGPGVVEGAAVSWQMP
jgi:hypothetical protein